MTVVIGYFRLNARIVISNHTVMAVARMSQKRLTTQSSLDQTLVLVKRILFIIYLIITSRFTRKTDSNDRSNYYYIRM